MMVVKVSGYPSPTSVVVIVAYSIDRDVSIEASGYEVAMSRGQFWIDQTLAADEGLTCDRGR